jgi:hypothetical protein
MDGPSDEENKLVGRKMGAASIYCLRKGRTFVTDLRSICLRTIFLNTLIVGVFTFFIQYDKLKN